MRDEPIGRGLGADHNQSVVNIRSAIYERIGNAHPQRDETTARFGCADDFLPETVRSHRVSPFATEVADKKAQRREINTRLCMIMNRVEAKRFRGPGVRHQRSGNEGLLRECQDCLPIMSRRDLCKKLTTIGNAK